MIGQTNSKNSIKNVLNDSEISLNGSKLLIDDQHSSDSIGIKSKCSFSDCSRCFEELKNQFNQQLKFLKVEFDVKIETLHKVIEKKDEAIGELQKDIGELQKTCSYLSQESTDI